MRKGISLILLVITIIVIIILSGSIILTILPNNVISDSKTTVQKADFKTISDEFNLYKSNLYTKTDGKFDMTTINADSTNIGTICKTAEKYKDIFKIVNGNLEYTGNNSTEKSLAKEYSMIYYGTEKTGTSFSINNSLEATIPSLTIYGKSIQNVPSGYTFYDYIESSGTQYIDTGFKSNSNTKVEISINISTLPTAIFSLFGGRDGLTTNTFSVWGFVSSGMRWDYNSNQLASGSLIVGDNTIIKDKNTNILNNITVSTNTGSSFQSNYNLTLFGINTAGIINYPSSFKLKKCKIWDNGTLIRNMLPAKRSSDNAVGMYDLQNNIFYINAGTGTFTTGTVINLPSPEYPIVINSANNFNLVQTNKQNLVKYSEPTKSSELETSGYITFRNSTGKLVNYVSNEIYFQTLGTTAWAYFYSGSFKPSKDIYLEFYVEMDDGSAPILSGSTTSGDLGIVINAGLYPTTSNFTVTNINGTNIYIIASKIKFTITSNTGIVKYSGQSNKKFRVSRFKAVEDINYGYIKTTGLTITDQKNTNIVSTLRAIKVANNSSIYTYQDDTGNRYIADYIEMKNGKVNLVRNVAEYTYTGNESFNIPAIMSPYQRFYNNPSPLTSFGNTGSTWIMNNRLPVNTVGNGEGVVCTGTPLINLIFSHARLGILTTDNDTTRVSKVKTYLQQQAALGNYYTSIYATSAPTTTDITNTADGQTLLNLKTQKGYTNIYDSSGLNLWKKIVVKEM